MTSSLWERMRLATESLAKAAGYYGAGTAEFMVDDASGHFYFLEVNARLQVEHPVTEAITGLDLVQWQLRIAQGEALPSFALSRSDIRGHAIEARIVAEDPAKGFLPSIGEVLAWAEPHAPGVRVDTGYGPGSAVSRYYDSLLAKVIAHGSNRAEAIAKLKAALLDFHILGVRTNIAYVLDILDHPEFQAGRLDTGFLGRHFGEWSSGEPDPAVGWIAERASSGTVSAVGRVPMASAWGAADRFRNVG
jgi:acetyl/propionyl-CoA carboxylase alpha subunit